MKVTKENVKWGQLTEQTHGVTFVGEELVPLMIPKDKQNPVKERVVCINGNQIWLGVGENLKVPQSVASAWNDSYMLTLKAEESMAQEIEIKA